VCIFCYGQTGSGKTHTMAGSDVESYEGRGINYRALDDLFALNAARSGEARAPPPPAPPHTALARARRAHAARGAQRKRAAAQTSALSLQPIQTLFQSYTQTSALIGAPRGAAQAEYAARVQLLEIYNEQLRDLLDEQRSGRRLDIRSTERSGLNVPDAIQARPRVAAPAPGQRM